MADLVITVASVAPGSNPTYFKDNVAGETITAGMPVYLKAADQKWYKAKASVTIAEASVRGVSLHGALANQPLVVQSGGQVTIGATIAAGVFYYCSAAAFGGICPVADLASGNFVTALGYGVSTALLQIQPIVTGQTLA